MIFSIRLIARPVVSVVTFKRRVVSISGATRRVHVWRVKNNTINFPAFVGKIATIRASQNICRFQIICVRGNIPPKNTLTISNVSNHTAAFHIQIKNLRKYNMIAFS